MPIRPEYRHFYRGPAWRATRERILARAGNKCEQCGAPNHSTVLRACGWWTPATLEAVVFQNGGRIDGKPVVELPWHSPDGGAVHVAGFLRDPCRWAGIVLGVAHLNHVPGDDRDENLKALCGWCHLNYDKLHHKQTRCLRKDAARPLLESEARA